MPNSAGSIVASDFLAFNLDPKLWGPCLSIAKVLYHVRDRLPSYDRATAGGGDRQRFD